MSENEGSERDMSAAQMGFTIMQQMIEAHYGTITLESTEGKGTKVTVNLPADRDAVSYTHLTLPTIRLV